MFSSRLSRLKEAIDSDMLAAVLSVDVYLECSFVSQLTRMKI